MCLFTFHLGSLQIKSDECSGNVFWSLLTSVCCSVLCSAVLMSVQLTRAEQGSPGVASVTRVYAGHWLRMIPVTQAGAPCSVSVYASVSVTTWRGWCPVPRPLPGFTTPRHSQVSIAPLSALQSSRERRHWHWLPAPALCPVWGGPSLIPRHQSPQA